MDTTDLYILADYKSYTYDENDSYSYDIYTYDSKEFILLTKEMYNDIVNNINFNFLLILFSFGFLTSLICCRIKEKYVLIKTIEPTAITERK